MDNPRTALQTAEADKEIAAAMLGKVGDRWAAVAVLSFPDYRSANPTMNWVLFTQKIWLL